MANNYEQGATSVPASCLAAGGAQAAEEILEHLTQILEYVDYFDSDDRPQRFDDFYSGCLDVQAQSDGSLYIASGDEYFCAKSFDYLIEKLAERNLILKSFGIQIAYTCSKPRPDEFGGTYFRAFPCGKVLAMGTQLDDLTDEQFEQIYRIRTGV